MSLICPFCHSTLDATLTLVLPPPGPPPPPPPPPAAGFSVQQSATANRLAPTPLDGSTVSGNIFVFTLPEVGVTQVRFFLDGSASPVHVENYAPFDFVGATAAGAALPYNTAALPNGSHTIAVQVDKGGVTSNAMATFTVSNAAPPPPPPAPVGTLRVAGNRIVDQGGVPVMLRGFSQMGMEYSCVEGKGVADFPLTQATVDGCKTWKGANIVRLPLNEDGWLGINGANPGGAAYQTAVKDYVALLAAAGFYVLVDLHWTRPGTALATGQDLMASADHSPLFWTEVATAFKNDPHVLFDLYNEPHDVSWSAWHSGGGSYAGMQQLIDAVRATGATNIVVASGLDWGNDLSGWLANRPTDPAGNLVAGWHAYQFNPVNTQAKWDAIIAPVAAQVPVLCSEFGDHACNPGYLSALMSWCDSKNVGYIAWTFQPDPGNSCTSIQLITARSGTPSQYGQPIHDHLAMF